jgi:hypothetical protein
MQILAKAALRPSDESGPSRDLSNLPESVVLGAGAEAPGTEAEDPAPAASADGVANVPEGAAALVPFDVDTSAPWSGGMND